MTLKRVERSAFTCIDKERREKKWWKLEGWGDRTPDRWVWNPALYHWANPPVQLHFQVLSHVDRLVSSLSHWCTQLVNPDYKSANFDANSTQTCMPQRKHNIRAHSFTNCSSAQPSFMFGNENILPTAFDTLYSAPNSTFHYRAMNENSI